MANEALSSAAPDMVASALSPIVVSGVTRRIEGKTVLENVDLEVRHGEIFGLIGPDGAGKTSLFNVLMGFLTPDCGQATMLAQTPRAAKNRVSYLTQKFSCYLDLTVAENLIYAGTIHGVNPKAAKVRQDKYLTVIGLRKFANRRARDLSGGMKQKLALCCALLSDPQILLLDEPTTGVDPVARREFWDLLIELGSEMTTLIATPYLEEAERCDRVALMHHGKIIDLGTPEELKNRAGLPQAALENVFISLLGASRDESSISDMPLPASKRTQTNGSAAVVAKNLSKRFGDFVAVDSLNLSVPYGTIFGLLGANGAGKTTLIKMLCGLSPRTAGNITILGSNNPAAVASRSRMGYMSQRFTLYDDLTIIENLEFYAGVYGVSSSLKKPMIEWVLDFAELGEFANRLTGDLSAGWKQRVALGASIMHRPDVLFLDEPTSGMDPIARRTTWSLIRKLADEGAAILVSTHYMDEAEHCDQVGFMADGRLLVSDSPMSIRGAQPGTLIELRTADNIATAKLIKSFVQPWKVAIFANAVHVNLEKEDPSLQQLLTRVIDAGITVRSAQEIPFSLEDAFIRIISIAQGASI